MILSAAQQNTWKNLVGRDIKLLLSPISTETVSNVLVEVFVNNSNDYPVPELTTKVAAGRTDINGEFICKTTIPFGRVHFVLNKKVTIYKLFLKHEYAMIIMEIFKDEL